MARWLVTPHDFSDLLSDLVLLFQMYIELLKDIHFSENDGLTCVECDAAFFWSKQWVGLCNPDYEFLHPRGCFFARQH